MAYVPLREQLKVDSPDLYASFLRSWEIAENQWLPAVAVNKGSYNSHPHLWNLERYLDDLLNQHEQLEMSERARFKLRPVEKYLILAAILFHDIGRIQVGNGHAAVSAEIIKSKNADLGIPSKAIAETLADICDYHDPVQVAEVKVALTRDMDDLSQICTYFDEGGRRHLSDTSVAPYGLIRTKAVASLLKLVDHLDSAYSRVLPHFYAGTGEGDIIGAFRDRIPGIRIDLKSQMIVTQLVTKALTDESQQGFKSNQEVWSKLKVNKPKAASPSLGEMIASLKSPKEIEKVIDAFLVTPSESKNVSPEQLRNTPELKQYFGNESLKNSAAKLLRFLENKALCDYIDKDKDHPKPIFVKTDDENQEKIAKHLSDFIRFGMQGKVKEILTSHIYNLLETKLTLGIKEKSGVFLEITTNNKVQSTETEKVIEWNAFKTEENTTLVLPPISVENLPYLIMRQVVFVSTDYPPPHWDNKIMLCVIAGNVYENARVLGSMQRELRVLGIPTEAWLLEHNEHLFTCAGRETYEPCLTMELLKQTVEGMWNLSNHMFASGAMSYETLAAYLREPDVDRVKCSVRRIGIVSRGKWSGDTIIYPIAFSHGSWSWESESGGKARVQKNDILNTITQLAKPTADVVFRKHNKF